MRWLAVGFVVLFVRSAVPALDAPCPEGSRQRPQRVAMLLRLLETHPEGRALLGQIQLPYICFAAPGLGDTIQPNALLLSKAPAPAQAARLAHLLVHERDGVVRLLDADTASCRRAIPRLLASELRAHRLEIELRRKLGAPTKFEFERVFWTASPRRRSAALDRWLRQSRGFEALYHRQCAQ